MYEEYRGLDKVHWPAADAFVEPDGTVPYYNLYSYLQDETLITGRDEATMTTFGYFEVGGVVSFDNEWSICMKTDYGVVNNLGGYFIW
jgi:GH18 family chitinase